MAQIEIDPTGVVVQENELRPDLLPSPSFKTFLVGLALNAKVSRQVFIWEEGKVEPYIEIFVPTASEEKSIFVRSICHTGGTIGPDGVRLEFDLPEYGFLLDPAAEITSELLDNPQSTGLLVAGLNITRDAENHLRIPTRVAQIVTRAYKQHFDYLLGEMKFDARKPTVRVIVTDPTRVDTDLAAISEVAKIFVINPDPRPLNMTSPRQSPRSYTASPGRYRSSRR